MKIRLKYYSGKVPEGYFPLYTNKTPKPLYRMKHRYQVYAKFKEYHVNTSKIVRTTIGIPNVVYPYGYYYSGKYNQSISHKIGHPAELYDKHRAYFMWGKILLPTDDYPVWDHEVSHMLKASLYYAFSKT